MKKKAIFIIAGISIICTIAGCKSAYKEENSNIGGDNKNETVDITEREDIDWNAEKLTCELSSNITLDGTVIPKSVWDNEFGLYHYTVTENMYAETDEQKTEELAKKLDDYYGRNVTLIKKNIIKPLIAIENPIYRPDNREVHFRLDDTPHNDLLSHVLEAFLPVKITGYDEEKVNSKVNEIQDLLYDYTNVRASEFTVYWFGDKMYDTINEIQNKCFLTNVLNDEVMEAREEFYEIIIRPTLDNNIAVKYLPNIYYKKLDNENESDLIGRDDYGNEHPVSISNNMEIVLDDQYNMLSVKSYTGGQIDETPFEKVKILGMDEILQKFVKINKNPNVNIIDISLYYSAALAGELDENNNRDVFLAPYWVITYTWGNNNEEQHYEGIYNQNYQYIYSAVTGELVYSMN